MAGRRPPHVGQRGRATQGHLRLRFTATAADVSHDGERNRRALESIHRAFSNGVPMTDAQGLITVWLNVPPEHDEEFNDWYNLEHLRQVVALPGFVRARRYSVDDAALKYLAWHETVDESVESGRDFQGIVEKPT